MVVILHIIQPGIIHPQYGQKGGFNTLRISRPNFFEAALLQEAEWIDKPRNNRATPGKILVCGMPNRFGVGWYIPESWNEICAIPDHWHIIWLLVPNLNVMTIITSPLLGIIRNQPVRRFPVGTIEYPAPQTLGQKTTPKRRKQKGATVTDRTYWETQRNRRNTGRSGPATASAARRWIT